MRKKQRLFVIEQEIEYFEALKESESAVMEPSKKGKLREFVNQLKNRRLTGERVALISYSFNILKN